MRRLKRNWGRRWHHIALLLHPSLRKDFRKLNASVGQTRIDTINGFMLSAFALFLGLFILVGLGFDVGFKRINDPVKVATVFLGEHNFAKVSKIEGSCFEATYLLDGKIETSYFDTTRGIRKSCVEPDISYVWGLILFGVSTFLLTESFLPVRNQERPREEPTPKEATTT